MVKHVVCFKLMDNSEENKQKTKEVLLSMRGNVPTLRGIEVGTDFLGSIRSFDVYLSVLLDSKEALEQYQSDEYHCSVVKTYMHSVVEKSVALDFEIENN